MRNAGVFNKTLSPKTLIKIGSNLSSKYHFLVVSYSYKIKININILRNEVVGSCYVLLQSKGVREELLFFFNHKPQL